MPYTWSTTHIPAPEAFFLEVPPYASFQIGSWNFKDVLRVEFFQGTLDAYCLDCEKKSVFTSTTPLPLVGSSVPPAAPDSIDDLVENYSRAWLPNEEGDALYSADLQEHAAVDRCFSLEFECTRDSAHLLVFIFRICGSKIIKIGQFPSLADLQGQEVRKYRKVLGAKYGEFNRAVGLSAHGVGIGAFVYLRRIFEDLIEDAHTEASEGAGWEEEAFAAGRMEEKILLLKDFLPTFLVENRAIYSVLSKGIHSLSEEECLKHFDPLRLGIELILDEKIEQKERAEKISATKRALDSIRSDVE